MKEKDLVGLPARKVYGSNPRCLERDEYRELIVRDTQQWSVAEIFLWRLLNSNYMTKNSSEADLFFVPMYPRTKTAEMWQQCCQDPINLNIEERLFFLNKKNAHRHFFIIGKGHVVPTHFCDAWWKSPSGVLRASMRFAYSSAYGGSLYADRNDIQKYGPLLLDDPVHAFALAADDLYFDDEEEKHFYPNLVSIPYPSSFHWRLLDTKKNNNTSRCDAFESHRQKEERYFFATFIGSLHGGHAFASARAKIYSQCLQHEEHRCHFEKFHKDADIELLLRNSTFCLEPAGDTPYRKGLYDAMLAGCIPVVFTVYNAFVAPWHFWANHHLNSMVVINETEYLGKADFNIIDYLATHFDRERVNKMQHTIAKYSHRLQYALNEYPDDAFEIIIKGAWHHALSRG